MSTSATASRVVAGPALTPSDARPLRPRPLSGTSMAASASPPTSSSIPYALHHQLLNVAQRSRMLGAAPHEYHDSVLRADTAPKSMRTFKGHAKGILRGLFLALLVRLMLALALLITVTGGAAWYLWSHRPTDRAMGGKWNYYGLAP